MAKKKTPVPIPDSSGMYDPHPTAVQRPTKPVANKAPLRMGGFGSHPGSRKNPYAYGQDKTANDLMTVAMQQQNVANLGPAIGPTGQKKGFAFLAGMPIPDRIGDVQQQRFRRSQEQNRAWNNYHNDPGMFGRDGGVAPNDTEARPLPNRGGKGTKRNSWNSNGLSEQDRGLGLPDDINPHKPKWRRA